MAIPNFLIQTMQRLQRGGQRLISPQTMALQSPGQPNYQAFNSVFHAPDVGVPLPMGSSSLFTIDHTPKA